MLSDEGEVVKEDRKRNHETYRRNSHIPSLRRFKKAAAGSFRREMRDMMASPEQREMDLICTSRRSFETRLGFNKRFSYNKRSFKHATARRDATQEGI